VLEVELGPHFLRALNGAYFIRRFPARILIEKSGDKLPPDAWKRKRTRTAEEAGISPRVSAAMALASGVGGCFR